MRITAVPVLCVVNLGLAAALVALWVQPDGALRDVRWTPPAPVPPNLAGLLPDLDPARTQSDVGQFLAILERPLFSATRRPPPPPEVKAAPPPAPPPPPPDPLANVLLAGVYGGADGGGAILQIQGKPRLVRLTEAVGDWKVESVEERSVTFKRGTETRVLSIVPVRELPPTNAAGSASAPAAGSSIVPFGGQAAPRASPRRRNN